jgi:hypothetical protein
MAGSNFVNYFWDGTLEWIEKDRYKWRRFRVLMKGNAIEYSRQSIDHSHGCYAAY